MKVLCTGLFPFWQCHLVAECNFLEEHLAAGDEISVLACDRCLTACDANPGMSRAVCMACIGLRQSALSLLRSSPRVYSLASPEARRRAQAVELPRLGGLAELESYEWEGLPAGKDVVSSLAAATGLPRPKPAECPRLLQSLLRDYIAVLLTARELLERMKFDRVYVFNGRFAAARAWMRACEAAGVEYITQERMGMPDRVLTVRNGSPHENPQFARMIREFWEARGQEPSVRREAADFFEERPAGRLTGWMPYVGGQVSGRAAALLAGARRWVAVFPSSEAEFAGVPEYFRGAAFADQRQAYLDIARALAVRAP
ncbi:MAG: hypothetical protein N2322_06075, partial [Terrimicrobiaceae bacterium]|nr:hypothetical protein [Terrimicrobiaceae bacterium]